MSVRSNFRFAQAHCQYKCKISSSTHETTPQTPRLHHHRRPKMRHNIPVQLPNPTSPNRPRRPKRNPLLRLELRQKLGVVLFPISPTPNRRKSTNRRSQPLLHISPPRSQANHDFSPKVKIIALLRNPVERAISHYYYHIKIGYESLLSFEEAIAARARKTQR